MILDFQPWWRSFRHFDSLFQADKGKNNSGDDRTIIWSFGTNHTSWNCIVVQKSIEIQFYKKRSRRLIWNSVEIDRRKLTDYQPINVFEKTFNVYFWRWKYHGENITVLYLYIKCEKYGVSLCDEIRWMKCWKLKPVFGLTSTHLVSRNFRHFIRTFTLN